MLLHLRKMMRGITKENFLRKLCATSPALLKNRKLAELVRVYHDLEKTLLALKHSCEKSAVIESSLKHIDVRKLIVQLSRSKRRLERKIANTLLLEKQQFKRRFRALTSSLGQKQEES